MNHGNTNLERDEFIKANWAQMSAAQIAEQWNTSRGAIQKAARRLMLPGRKKQNRHLTNDHVAIRNRTTRFPKAVVQSRDSDKLLVEGWNQTKLGFVIHKGAWKGAAIYALTLTERDTCPKSCSEWLTCYGNNMNWSRRHTLDAHLMLKLNTEVEDRLAGHKNGIAIRLHVLGDFGRDAFQSMPYVQFWAHQLEKHAQLRLFGYTAHKRGSITGRMIMERLNQAFPDRCRIRFSDDPGQDGFGGGVIDPGAAGEGVVCPVERNLVRDCAHCGLCWAMERAVLFERH